MVTTCELIKRVYLSGDNDGSDVPMVIRSKLWVLKKYQAPFTSWSQPQTSSGGSGGGGVTQFGLGGLTPRGGGGVVLVSIYKFLPTGTLTPHLKNSGPEPPPPRKIPRSTPDYRIANSATYQLLVTQRPHKGQSLGMGQGHFRQPSR